MHFCKSKGTPFALKASIPSGNKDYLNIQRVDWCVWRNGGNAHNCQADAIYSLTVGGSTYQLSFFLLRTLLDTDVQRLGCQWGDPLFCLLCCVTFHGENWKYRDVRQLFVDKHVVTKRSFAVLHYVNDSDWHCYEVGWFIVRPLLWKCSF